MDDNQNTPKYLENATKIVDKWVEYKRFFKRVPGIAVGIVFKDSLVFSNGYGYEDLKTKKKLTDKTCFRIASISKTFTATVMMQLAEQEKLQLDDKVRRYLPWFKSTKDKELDKITIKQLLSHSSGVNRDGDTSHWEDDNFPNLESIKKQVQEGVSIYAPIEKFKYSNLGFAILGEVIKAVSGKSYENCVTKQIIAPLQMTNTYPDLVDEAKNNLSTGYSMDIPGQDREVFPFTNTQAMASATGFISNVVDLCKYLSAHFAKSNKLLSDGGKREIQRVHWMRKDKDEHYGLGFMIWKNEKMQLVGHGGGFQGYITRIAMDTEEKIGVVALTNAIDGPALTIANGIFQVIRYFKDNQDSFKTGKKRENFSKYEGLFAGRWGHLQIVEVNGHIFGFAPSEDKPMEYTYKLEYLEKDEFKILETDEFDYIGEKIKFTFDKDKRLAGLVLGPNPMKLFTIPK
ncbi:MAG: serine hydrolase domain-containing protein [Patescibacteria group bacterium]